MAKANQRSGWRKSKKRAVTTTTSEFGLRGRERRKLLFQVSMLATFALVLLALLWNRLNRAPDLDVPLIVSVVSSSGARSNDEALFTAPNPYALEDVELLQAWFGDGPGDPSENVRFVGELNDASGVMDYEPRTLITAVTKRLARVVPGGPDGDMIAIYLGAHGFVDKGTPYLAVGNSRADREKSWIPFQDLYDEILKTLRERDDAGRDIRTVLFIDAARVGPQWDWGQFSESFADACARLTAGQSGKVAVILSSSPGERSWWDPRKGHGLFTRALIEALTGKGDKNQDNTVTVGEIADYLKLQVRLSAAAIWDAKQTPMMVSTEAADWSFISQPQPETAPTIEEVDANELRSDLDTVNLLWNRHNELARRTHPPLAYNPLGWATLEKKLARLDALRLAGKGYRNQFRAMRTDCESDLAQFEYGSNTMPQLESLPELALSDYFHSADEESPAFNEMVTQWRKKPEIAAVQVPMNETQAIRFLWPWLQEKAFDSNSLALSAELLENKDLVTRSRPATFLESHLARLLASRDLSHLDQQTIATLAESHLQSRNTLCADDLRASFWVRQRLSVLDGQRMSCIDQMLSKNPDAQADGLDRWRRDVKPKFIALQQSAKTISHAYKLRDQMLHSIPRIAETLMSDLEAFENQEQFEDSQSRAVLQRGIKSVSQLATSLQLPQDDDNRPMESLERHLSDVAAEAQVAFDALNKRITDRLNEATAQKAADAKGLRQNFALLVGSGTSNAELRQRVHTRLCELIADTSDGGGSAQNSAVPPKEGPASTNALDLMTIEGKQAWDYWLAASEDLNQTSNPNESAEPTGQTPVLDELVKQFQNTGATFRTLVADLAEGRLGETVTADRVMSDPIERAKEKATLASTRRELEKWDTYLRGRTMLFTHAPMKVERIGKGRFALDQQLFLFDHASRTMSEFWCEARRGDQPFFVGAAGRLLASRNQNPLFPSLAMNLDGVSLSEDLAATDSVATSSTTLQPEPAEMYRDGTLLKFVAGKNVEFVLDHPSPLPSGYASIWAEQSDQTKAVLLRKSSDASITVPMLVPTELPPDEAEIVAGVFYRGMRRTGRIVFKTLEGGKRTVFDLPDYGPPAVRVVRKDEAPERLLLVFDCSLSMMGLTKNRRSRLDIARDAITGFLNRLQPGVEVGLILFGDRYGFKQKGTEVIQENDKGVQKLRVMQFDQGQLKNMGLILPNAQVPENPNYDVRVAVPIHPLNATQRPRIIQQLANAGAIGPTPTYLAIKKAYELLGRQGGHVILLTDGKPQLIGEKMGYPINDSRSDAIKVVAKRANDVRLTIVKYLNKDTQLKSDFPSADVLDAADGAGLLRHLEAVRSKAEVVWQRNREAASRTTDFGALLAISKWPPKGVGVKSGQPVLPAESFSVRAVVPDARLPLDKNAPVRVEGGEQFELTLADQELTHRPFDYQFTQLQSISTQLSDANRYAVSAGPISKRENRQLTMQLAIESATGGKGNGKFTRRPSDIWVELTGIDSRRTSRQAKEVYSFSLPEFLTRQAIPIVLCRIDDFSQRYDKVEVKAWLRFGEERLQGASITLSNADSVTVDGLPGVSFRTQRTPHQANGIRLTVTEQYSDEREPGTVRVLPTPLPNRASTTTYTKDRVIVRTFDFDDDQVEVTLNASDRSEIQDKSSLYAEGTVEIDFDSR